MNNRILSIIDYATNGKQKDFAELFGWSNQYTNRLTADYGSIGLKPITAILERFPEINARWLLLGEGEMFNFDSNSIHSNIRKLIKLEPYLSVMNQEEIMKVENGSFDFLESDYERWESLKVEREKVMDDLFRKSFERSKKSKHPQETCKE